MDESGFMMGYAASSKVVDPAGKDKKHFVTHDGGRKGVTVVECISAAGGIIPPMLILNGEYHQVGWHRESTTPPDWTFAISKKGWIDEELALTWLRDIFEPSTRPTRLQQKRLLIVDGHNSHIQHDFVDFCVKSNIIALCLPSHSTHMVQPLDVGCFSPYKRYYGVEVDNATRNGVTAINKTIFIDLLQKARRRTLIQSTILSAWRGAGLVPFDPDIVLTQLPNYAPLRPQTPISRAPILTAASITTPTTLTGISAYLSTI